MIGKVKGDWLAEVKELVRLVVDGEISEKGVWTYYGRLSEQERDTFDLLLFGAWRRAQVNSDSQGMCTTELGRINAVMGHLYEMQNKDAAPVPDFEEWVAAYWGRLGQQTGAGADLPPELDNDTAKHYLEKAKEKGLIDGDFNWTKTLSALALFADEMSRALGLTKGVNGCYRPFELLFGKNNLRQIRFRDLEAGKTNAIDIQNGDLVAKVFDE